MIRCRQCEILLPQYARGELKKEQEAAVAAHLQKCERCALAFKETIVVLELARKIPTPPLLVPLSVLVQSTMAPSARHWFRLRRSALIPVLAALALLIAPRALVQRTSEQPRVAGEHMFLPSEEMILEMINVEDDRDARIAAHIFLRH